MTSSFVIEAVLVLVAMILGAGAGIMVIVLHDKRPAGSVPCRCGPSVPARQLDLSADWFTCGQESLPPSR